MRKLKESRAMQDDLISCVTILGFSIFYISDHLELEPWHRTIMTVGLVFCIAEMILRLWRLRRNKRMTPEEQREAKRENSDERSRMILDKATKYCWSIEDALLLIGFHELDLREQPAVNSVLNAHLAVRI